MKHISLSGSYSVGKSTVMDKLNPKGWLKTNDLAREYLSRHNLNSNSLTDEQRRQLQLWVTASYIGNMKQAESAKMNHLMDSSLIEVYAYSDGVLPENQLMYILNYLMKYREDMIALVFPPTIKLEDDGLRHIDKEFRLTIHGRIMQVIDALQIPYHYIVSSTVEDRVEEIKTILNSVE
jgi:nicotinamide riboside kinase